MTRTRTSWKFRDRSIVIGERTLIIGVLNLTPDSFSDGGKYTDPDRATHRAFELMEQGADILDVGAESTRPGSTRLSAADELKRLIPVLNLLRKRDFPLPISVDTYKSEVADAALLAGAHIINDISALSWDFGLAKVVVHYDAGLILSHVRGTPETWAKLAPIPDVMGVVIGELEASLHRAVRAGVDRRRVVLDPGLGFGKRKEQNSEILARLAEMRKLTLPVAVGPSRKSFLAQEDPLAREFATAAAVTACVLGGAAMVRVHDVSAMKVAVQVADAIMQAIPEPVVATERTPVPAHAGPPREAAVPKLPRPQPGKPGPSRSVPQPPRFDPDRRRGDRGPNADTGGRSEYRAGRRRPS
ncbi:MAG TPA: dihydropteroate synthase [Bryobacteraceae bacterium]|nr:dihydropteroate synthase [Bryobacteraceae bacterium]